MKRIVKLFQWIVEKVAQDPPGEIPPPKNRAERRMRDSIQRRQRSLKL